VPEKISFKGTNFLATINASILPFYTSLFVICFDNEVFTAELQKISLLRD